MMKFPAVLLLAVAVFLGACASRPPLKTVERLDLERYTGRWYEIARYPNSFQRRCTGGVTADYTAQADGSIRVVNRCATADGKGLVAEGRATVVPGSGDAKLRVTFFWPFAGDYWVIGLDERNYQWALIGDPSRKFLWILARQPEIPELTYDKIVAEAVAKGYDATRLVRTDQSMNLRR